VSRTCFALKNIQMARFNSTRWIPDEQHPTSQSTAPRSATFSFRGSDRWARGRRGHGSSKQVRGERSPFSGSRPSLGAGFGPEC
jgi:hypothetical protein